MRYLGWAAPLALFIGLLAQPDHVNAQSSNRAQWIWAGDDTPGKRYFRKDLSNPRPADEATLDITADDRFEVWINGRKVGEGNDPKRVYAFDVREFMPQGRITIAVLAENTGGSAGLLVRLAYVPNGQSRLAQLSDASWKVSSEVREGWEKAELDDKDWAAARIIGPYGDTKPWGNLKWDSGGDDRFSVPPGFVVEQVAHNPLKTGPFSLVNMTFDANGNLLVSQERGPILLCSDQDENGVFQNVKTYCATVRNCQGMCWVKDALLLVGDGPRGTGLYRVRDTDGNDRTDKWELIHKVKGGMGEHGPHAIIHGPDGWLYFVIGNHANAQPEQLAPNSPLLRWPDGLEGPDQGQPKTTEDILLPRQNDGRGHAANKRAPGGTIWRLDHEGKNWSLVAAGFRNQYDAAFSPSGELFTFDSDMEWDEGMPWYRAVRVCHCPPGSDFGWRTGSSKKPEYYIDNLPPIAETGRGSPVGVEFYDHTAFPLKYRDTFFMADWAIGVIFAVHLERDGAGYKTKVDRFCVGAPMNVTDLVTGPDGALYFTMGGRGTQGGVFRIRYAEKQPKRLYEEDSPPQPLAAWSRKKVRESLRQGNTSLFAQQARDSRRTPRERLFALDQMQNFQPAPDANLLLELLNDKEPIIRAHAVSLLGIHGYSEGRRTLVEALNDNHPLVRRRACEALIRAGFEPQIPAILPLLGDSDRYVRTAARLVIQRIDPQKWAVRLWNETNQMIVREGITALANIHQVAAFADEIFDWLNRTHPQQEAQPILDHLRVLQLALVHSEARPDAVRELAAKCVQFFPYPDWRVKRELAILMTYFAKADYTDAPVHEMLLNALLQESKDRKQQMHYFLCLRLLHKGWTSEQKAALLNWYEETRHWQGGHSMEPFLENILKDLKPAFDSQDVEKVIANAESSPWAAKAILGMVDESQISSPNRLAELFTNLHRSGSGEAALKAAIVEGLGNCTTPDGQAALRKVADTDPSLLDSIVRKLARHDTPQNWPWLIKGLQSSQRNLVAFLMMRLKQSDVMPNKEDAQPFRAVLTSAGRLSNRQKQIAVDVLRKWGKQKFGAEGGDVGDELDKWSLWFVQSFPKEPALPDVTVATAESKWKADELLKYLNGNGQPGSYSADVARGRQMFEKANCIKCHKFGTVGEGIGPDLTTLKGRFNRADLLDSLLAPSRIISDQYRGSTIVTVDGETITGLAAIQGDTMTVLQEDGSKVTIKAADVEERVASTLSPMPEKLLDELTKEEIADLFAYLESDPNAAPNAAAGK